MNPIEQELKEKYSNIRFELYINNKLKKIYLTGFIVPASLRNKGVGTSFMEDLTKLADQYGYQITLTPDRSYGGNVNRLKDFYQRFGFVFNKGNEKDFTHKELMHRNPKTVNEEETPTSSSTTSSGGTSPSNSPAPERTKRGKANPISNTSLYDFGTARGKANPISNKGDYVFNTQRGPANPINEQDDLRAEILNKVKTYKIPYKEFNRKMKTDWIPMWKEEYGNDLARINELVARQLLYQISQDLFGGVNEIEFANQSKNPTNHFQLVMYVDDMILWTSPFIYVDNNHNAIAKRSKIEVLDSDYETLSTLKENVNEGSTSGKTILSVDVQPEYQKYINFNINEWVNMINQHDGRVVFLYNGYDTLGMVRESEYKSWLFDLGVDEEIIYDTAIFYDKGYAFFRHCIDNDIDDEDIVGLVKMMIEYNINDSRGLDEEFWSEFIERYGRENVRELLEFSDDCINIPDLMDFLNNFSNILLCGGGKNECLKEVEIALMALDKPYDRMDSYIYEKNNRLDEAIIRIKKLINL